MVNYDSPIGSTFVQGGTIINILADARETESVLVCLLKKPDGLYVAKFIGDSNITSRTVRTMKKLETIDGYHLPIWYMDRLTTSSGLVDDDILIMEKLEPIHKEQVFDMVESLIAQIYTYRDYMAHCDIKPDNIMYSPRTKLYHLIDYDSVCNEPLMYGFERTAFTPLFASQSSVGFIIATIKQDLLELLWSAHTIYYETDHVRPFHSFPKACGHRKAIFDIACMVVWNIDERNITIDDMTLLFYVLDLTKTAAANNNLFKQSEVVPICQAFNKKMSNKKIYGGLAVPS